MENIAKIWGDYMTCDDATLNMGDIEKARVMIWSSQVSTINCIMNLEFDRRMHEVEIREISYEDVFCSEVKPKSDVRVGARWLENVVGGDLSSHAPEPFDEKTQRQRKLIEEGE